MNITDIHIHGISGYDTRTTDAQDILKLAEIQASCGVYAIIPTIYPDTIEVMRENMLAVKKAMEVQKQEARSQMSEVRSKKQEVRKEKQEERKYATILGINLEGPFLNPKKCGALNAASFIEATEYNLKKLVEGFEDIVKIITIAPEITGALKLIKQASDMGIVVSMGHSDAIYTEAEAGFNAGAKGITHLFNAMSSLHHREPGLAGFGLLNNEIYTEVIADPYHLHPKTLELIFRIKDPERIILVSDTVKCTKLAMNNPPSPPLEKGGKGGFEALFLHSATDTSGKLLGGAMTITDASKRLIDLGYDRELITPCISKNPSKHLAHL